MGERQERVYRKKCTCRGLCHRWGKDKSRYTETSVPVRVYVADAREQAERAPELGVDAVVEQHELSVRRGEAQLPHRLELVKLGAFVEVAVLRDGGDMGRRNGSKAVAGFRAPCVSVSNDQLRGPTAPLYLLPLRLTARRHLSWSPRRQQDCCRKYAARHA